MMEEEEERTGKICPPKCQQEDADELIGSRVHAVLMMMEVRVCACVYPSTAHFTALAIVAVRPINLRSSL